MRESQDTKLIFAPRFTVGVARVAQYGLLLQISQRSVIDILTNTQYSDLQIERDSLDYVNKLLFFIYTSFEIHILRTIFVLSCPCHDLD